MQITENVTIYQCDHCKKKMVRKHAMINHETNCYCNPDNQRACSGCAFLEETEIEYIATIYTPFGESGSERITKGFRCSKLNQVMYPFKAEKKGLIEKYPESFEGQVPMPKTCELRDTEDFPW